MASMIFLGAAVAAPPAPKPLEITLPYEGPVAVAVLDARPDVVNGERKETFIGFTCGRAVPSPRGPLPSLCISRLARLPEGSGKDY